MEHRPETVPEDRESGRRWERGKIWSVSREKVQLQSSTTRNSKDRVNLIFDFRNVTWGLGMHQTKGHRWYWSRRWKGNEWTVAGVTGDPMRGLCGPYESEVSQTGPSKKTDLVIRVSFNGWVRKWRKHRAWLRWKSYSGRTWWGKFQRWDRCEGRSWGLREGDKFKRKRA